MRGGGMPPASILTAARRAGGLLAWTDYGTEQGFGSRAVGAALELNRLAHKALAAVFTQIGLISRASFSRDSGR